MNTASASVFFLAHFYSRARNSAESYQICKCPDYKSDGQNHAECSKCVRGCTTGQGLYDLAPLCIILQRCGFYCSVTAQLSFGYRSVAA